MKNSSKRLILLDGNAIIHRAFHALPPLTTKSGELVNAVYGFTSTLLSVIENFKPDYVACSFDLAAPTFRHEQFEQYKATRSKAPDELYSQIPLVKEVVKTFNIPIYEKAGFEADDVIGTLSRQATESEIETIVVTGDMDTLQLVSPFTKVYAMRRGISDSVMYDEEKVFERYGLKPNQIIDYKGLRGDPSDNIPGVKGIGEKTAIALLQAHQTVEGVYAEIDSIKGAIKEKLVRDKANALLSKELATIHLHAPVKLDLDEAKIHDFDREKLVSLFGKLNFYSLVKRLPSSNVQTTQANTEKNSDGVHPVKSSTGRGAEQFDGVKDFKYEIVAEKNFSNFLEELAKQTSVAMSVETSSENKTDIIGIAFSWKAGRASFVSASLEILEKLKPVLEKNSLTKIGYDLKHIYKLFLKQNIELSNLDFDVMIAAYLLNPGTGVKFETLILEEFGEEVNFEEKKKGQLSLVEQTVDLKEISFKLCQKADYAFKLKQVLTQKIQAISNEQTAAKLVDKTLWQLFAEIEMPLVKILAEMEHQGIKINTLIFSGISQKITLTLKNLEKSIYELAGTSFNINSPQQLASILFEKMQLPTFNIKKTKKGFSTAAPELEKLHKEHKIIGKIEQYRELFKLKTTYLDALPKLIDEKSRLHTTFNQAVTATGRLSSTEPNLQNIPTKTDLGHLLRTAFVAEDDCTLIGADYSQIDLRAVAHVSGDQKLIEAFHRGDDIHKITAAQVYKVTPSQVTDTMRRNAKALNFGVIYGMSSFGFSQSAKISREEAQKFINEYMEKFSGVAKYMKDTRESARTNGYVETLLGRRRLMPEINSANFQIANAAERTAINMPIQGLAADLVKLAMIKIQAFFEGNPDVKMLLQIHDEIILEVKKEKAQEIAQKIKELMESAYKLSVPLVVNVEIGESWGEI